MKRDFFRAFQNQAHVITVILRQTKIRHGDAKAALQPAVLIKDRSGNTGAMAIPLAIPSRKSFFLDAHDFLSQKLHIYFRSGFVSLPDLNRTFPETGNPSIPDTFPPDG